MKFTSKEYGGTREILKVSGHFVSIPVTVSGADITVDSGGLKILKAGTIIGGKTKAVLANRAELVVIKNDAAAEGVILNDVDVTHGDAMGAMIIHGFINSAKLSEAPSNEAVSALTQITFLN